MSCTTRRLFIVLAIALSTPCHAQSAQPAVVDVGAGLGIAYGLVGVNAEVGAGPVVGTASLGWCDFWGWGVGARWYLGAPGGVTDQRQGWRVGAQYGVVAFLNSEDGWFFPVDNRGAEGLCLSAGYRWRDCDLELGVPFYSVPEGYDDLLNFPVQFSFGVRFGSRD